MIASTRKGPSTAIGLGTSGTSRKRTSGVRSDWAMKLLERASYRSSHGSPAMAGASLSRNRSRRPPAFSLRTRSRLRVHATPRSPVKIAW